MARRKRKSVLDRWQTVLDETKGLVDDEITRLRSRDDERDLEDSVAELRRAVRDLNAKLERLAQDGEAQSSSSRKSTSKTA